MTRSCSSCSRTGRTRIGLTRPPDVGPWKPAKKPPIIDRLARKLYSGPATEATASHSFDVDVFSLQNDAVIASAENHACRIRHAHDPDRRRRPVGHGYVRADAPARGLPGAHGDVNAEAGLELADNVAPDAIILDLRMPLVDGLQFLRALRSKDVLSKMPVAIVTGDYFLDDDAIAERAARARRRAALQAAVARGSGRARPQPAQGVLTSRERSVPQSLPARAGRRHAGLVHAPGRPLHGRIPGAASERYSLLEICRTPELATEVTLQPVRRHRGRRRDPLLRSAAAARADGPRRSTSSRAKGRRSRSRSRREADVERLRGSSRARRSAHVLEAIRLMQASSPGACRSSASPARRSRWRPTRSKAATRTTSRRPRR